MRSGMLVMIRIGGGGENDGGTEERDATCPTVQDAAGWSRQR